MFRRTFITFVLALALTGRSGTPFALAQQLEGVLSYHNAPDRSGHFIVPGLTAERARGLHLDTGFHAQVSGHVYAQPLFWRGGGASAGMLLVATEDNIVHALDGGDGHELWRRTLGPPVARAALGCGNISPLGITGTPVIDAAHETLYVSAAVNEEGRVHHRVFALSLKDGAVQPGWPVDVAAALRAHVQTFNARDQNQRGALTILDGTLYVPFGGHFGDCGDYHGWVVGISLGDPRSVSSFVTRGRGGGIWAPGGIASADGALFVATGNTFGASRWSDGEAVFRVPRALKHSNETRDFFAPPDWRALDERDADLGGSNPLPLAVPDASGTRPLLLALGKDSRAYVLDRNNLGGIGGSLIAETVSIGPIRTAPATYRIGSAIYVAFQGRGAHCPSGSAGGGLTVLKLTAGSSPSLTTAWCGALRGAGSPIVTTTDGGANPIVWILGAEGDERLHGFNGETGDVVFNGRSRAETMTGLRHFQTLIATDSRLYVAADGRVYAFAF
ncbi:MAG TPA: hypothetical protein VFB45_25070 [Pseudolabrys sp.]|nr:hypothetical protein [Pseudolabrys sp.]